MPKKARGENSKAVEARARKAEAKATAAAQKEKEIEDAYWKDDDKQINRKMQRKAGREQKRQEELSRKLENKKLLEEEEVKIKSASKAPGAKMTRAQVEANQERMERERAEEAAAKKPVSHLDTPLEENTNVILAKDAEEGVVGARDVDEAIAALSVEDAGAEKHPEKRVKAAFVAYEEERMPALKAENPNLRLSQLKQMLKKEWMKSPENPLNQRFQAYNTKK